MVLVVAPPLVCVALWGKERKGEERRGKERKGECQGHRWAWKVEG